MGSLTGQSSARIVPSLYTQKHNIAILSMKILSSVTQMLAICFAPRQWKKQYINENLFDLRTIL